MKRKFTKLMAAFALLLFIVPPMVGWGQTSNEVTYTFSQHYNANTTLTDVAIAFDDNITATFHKGSGSTAPQYYTNGTAVRWYGGNTLDITATNATISAIEFTYTQKNKDVTANVGEYNHDNGTWTGSESSVTFTVASGSGHNRVSKIKVTYVTSGGSTTPSISANNVEIAYNVTSGSIEYSIENGSGNVTAEVTTGDWLTLGTITASAVSFTCSANEAATARTATVTLSYEGANDKVVTVTQDGNPNVVDNIEDITAAGNYTVKGTIVAKSTRGFVLGDGTGYIYYYKGSDVDQNVGDIVKISGQVSAQTNYKVFQYNSAATITTAETSNYQTETPTALTGSEMDAVVTGTNVLLSNYIQYEGILTYNNNYYNITSIDGATTAKGSISYPTSTDFASLNGKTVTVTGYYVGVSSNQYYNTMIGSIEEVVVPSITVTPATVNAPVAGADGILTVAYGNISTIVAEVQFYSATGAPATYDWIQAEIDNNNNVYYLIEANNGEARTAYLKVCALDDDANYVYSNLVTISQDAYVAPVINANDISLPYDATSGSIAYTISNPVANTNLTATLQEGIDWISDVTVNENTVTFNTATNNGNANRTATITLSYTGAADKVVTVTQILPSVTGTIAFGNGEGRVMINSSDVTSKDDLDNTWTIHTEGTTSFTNNANTGFAQVGSSSNPATSIVFTTSLGAGTTITAIEAKFGGNNNTAGDINLFVDNTNVGSGALNATADVIVQSTTTQVGNTITVTVSNIARGVKCYYISYSYVPSTAPYITADAALPLTYDATSGSIAYTIGNPVEGGVLTATINDGSTIADLAIGTITNETVPFTCSANTTTTEHTATITLTYKDANNQILATKEVTLTQDRVPMQNVTMAFHPTAAMATIGIEAFTAPTLTINPAGLTVTYSSSDPTVATVDETTGVVTIGNSAGITEITATFAGNDAYYSASALYTLFVNDNPNVPVLTVDEANLTHTTAPVLWTPCSVTSYTLELAPVAISESFEGNAIPEDWTNNGVIMATIGSDGNYSVGFNASGDNLITPALNNPKAISFMYRRSSNSTAWSLEISYATSPDAETWTPIGTVSDATTDWQTFSASLNVTGEIYIRFKDTREGSGTHVRYIDLIQVAGEYTSQSVTGTSYTFQGLPAGATYFARVKGNDEYSNAVCFTTLPFTLDIAGYGNSAGGWHLIAIPVNENVTPTTANGIIAQTAENYDLYIFDESQDLEWRNYKEMDGNNHANFSELVSGKGYLYASKNNTQLTFTGTPYIGDGVVTLSKTENTEFSGWNLVGNPFSETAYIDYNYYTMNEEGSEIIAGENNEIAPMQGIFVIATENGESMTFYINVPGTGGIGGFEPDGFDKGISINVTRITNTVIDRAIVRFGEGRQLPKFQLNPNNTKLYIPQGNKDYAVVRSAGQGEMPVNFKASQNGTYTISVNAENMEMNYLHLIDNMTGADIDLLATPNYTFEAKTTDYASRFRLVFNANSVNENTNETFVYNNGSAWVISNQGEATLQVIDVTGRILRSESINGNATINLNETAGIYMFRLVNGESVKVQKIVVK